MVQDERFMRSAEADLLRDCMKEKEKLDWKQEVSFEELVKMMVDADIKRL